MIDQQRNDVDTYLVQLSTDPLTAVTEYYAGCLPNNPKAIEYLRRNEILGPSLNEANRWQVGFADRSLGKRIPKKITKLGRELRSKLEQIGVYRANGREHFRGMVTLPLWSFSEDGQLVVSGIYGLRIDMSNGGEPELTIGAGIINAQAMNHYEELVLCQSVREAWTFMAAGHENAICFAGEARIHPEVLGRVKRIIIASPEGEAGPFADCETYRLRLPAGISANQYVIEHPDDPDPLGSFIRNAPWLQAATTADCTEHTLRSQPFRPVASPVPAAPENVEVEKSATEFTIVLESRRWRIRNLEANKIPGILRVNVLVYSLQTDCFHVDTFDLYHARTRRAFLSEAADELGVAEASLRTDIGKVLLTLEQLQAEQCRYGQQGSVPKVPDISDTQRESALELLRAGNLMERIVDDFDKCGLIGERNGKLIGYLVATSRLLDKPLGLIVQSTSAAGKSSLNDAILRFMPEEDRLNCSAMTPQSLFYLGQQDLQHRILSVAEEAGVRSASYGLKLLQSDGKLSLISTAKEKGTGRLATQQYDVEGPISLMLTTTSTDVDPELMNRCLVVSVDESPEQTAAIHAQQRFARTLAGAQQRIQSQAIAQQHQNAQRLLRRIQIHNPYAFQLGFATSQTRFRRDHEKYLTLIHTITLLHQYQREIQTTEVNGRVVEFLEVTKQDIAQANAIAAWALGRSIDELSEPTRRLLNELFDWVGAAAKQQGLSRSEFTFTRRQAREALRWNATHLRNHLEQLVQAEYVVPQGRGQRDQAQGKLYRYSLLCETIAANGQPGLLGLKDAGSLLAPTARLNNPKEHMTSDLAPI